MDKIVFGKVNEGADDKERVIKLVNDLEYLLSQTQRHLLINVITMRSTGCKLRCASFIMVRCYAKASSIKNQLSLFIEKEAVRSEREERGY